MATGEVVWFEETGSDQAHRRVLPPAKDVIKAHHQFKKRIRHALRISNKEVQVATTKDELNKQIEEIQNGHSLDAVALENLDEASKSRDAYQLDRKHGAKRVGRWGQEFANAFAEFVSAYSGILDIVRGAGGPYGEIGYQTLSILLIVVVNKNNNDTKIKDLLDELRKSFPRLENWSYMYPTQPMRVLVANVYKQVTEFSRAAVKYFTQFWMRFLVAIIQPPSMGIDKIAASIHKNLAEINSEAMYGLHNRSQKIEMQVVSSGETIQQLKAQADEAAIVRRRMETTNDELCIALQEQRKKFDAYVQEVQRREQQEDEQRLKGFEQHLGVKFPSSEIDINTTKANLMRVFPNTTSFSPHIPATAYSAMSRRRLDSCAPYQSWAASAASGLLFLSGSTAHEGRRLTGLTHSWLSPAAIYVAEDLRADAKKVAFFSCHAELQSRSVPAVEIVGSVVLQVLKLKTSVLRERAVQFHAAVLSEAWRDTNNEKGMVRAMVGLLRDLLSAVKDLGRIFIVIDRLDQCESPLRIVMDELLRLVGDEACDVKLLVIAETSFGKGDWHPEYLQEDEFALNRLFVRKDWNQGRMMHQEMSRGDWPLTWSNDQIIQS